MALTIEEKRKYILEQRSKGVSDKQILSELNRLTTPAPQRGIAGEILPVGGAIGGGILGGIAGAGAGGFGVVPGAIAGATLGGAAGETAQQFIEKESGGRQAISTPQIIATGATSGALEATTAGLGKLAVKGAQAVRKPVVDFLAKISGYADNVVERALQRTPGAVEAVKRGEAALNDIVKRSAAGVQKLASDTLKQGKQVIENLSKKISLGGQGQTASRNILLKEGNRFIDNSIDVLRQNNIGVIRKNNELIFNRVNQPSRITIGSEQGAIQEAFNLLNNIQKNTSIKNIDATLERLIVLTRRTPSGSPTGGETKKIINEMIEQTKKFTEKVYPEYYQFLVENLPKRVAITEAKEIFGVSANPSPKEISQMTTKLLQLYNTGKLPVQEAVEKIGQDIGEDIGGSAAGTLVKTGDQMSVRAPNLTTRGAVKSLFEGVPRWAVKNYIETEKITGDLLNNPVINGIAVFTGKSVKTILQEMANLMEDKTIQ